MTSTDRVPSACPCCGAYALPSTAQHSALFAVCDVLVVKVLEQVGRRVVNGGPRSRRGQWNGRPFHLAHTVWPPDASAIDRSLLGSWDVVPAMMDIHGCCDVTSRSVIDMLDGYVRGLLATGTKHTTDRLRDTFEERLGLVAPGRLSAERAS